MNLLTTLATGITMLISFPANGQEAPVLWRGLTVGMSKVEVEKMLPEREIDMLEDCRTIVSPRFKADQLSSVTISPKWVLSKNNCIAPMTASLTEKYGDGVRTVLTVPGNQFKAQQIYDVYLWLSGGVEIEYRSQIGGKSWSLTYRQSEPSAAPQRIQGL